MRNPFPPKLFCLLTVLFFGMASVPAISAPTFIKTDLKKIRRLHSLHHKAEKLIAMNDLRGAVKIYSQIILMEPDDEVAYADMGKCYMVLGDLNRAEEAFQNALDINPENETAFLSLMKIHDPDGIAGDRQDTTHTSQVTEGDKATSDKEPVISSEVPSNNGTSEKSLTRVGDFSPPQSTAARNDMTFEERVQTALKNAGFYQGKIDGIIGPISIKAIQAFQKSHGLSADGKVGPKTWAQLEPFLTS